MSSPPTFFISFYRASSFPSLQEARMMMHHLRVREYSREQTEREILRLKNVRVKTPLASGVTVVSRRTCRTFRTFDMVWIDFRTRRIKRAGACWTRERDSARFADGRKFCLKKGLSAPPWERVLRSRIPRVLSSVLSLPLERAHFACVPDSFRSREEPRRNTRLCSSFYPTLTKPFPFLF